MAADPTLATVSALAGKVAGAARVLVKDAAGQNRLPIVAPILGAEMAAAFPIDGPLTPAARETAVKTFAKLHGALTEAGK